MVSKVNHCSIASTSGSVDMGSGREGGGLSDQEFTGRKKKNSINVTMYKDSQHLVLSIFITHTCPALGLISYKHEPVGLLFIQDKSSVWALRSIHSQSKCCRVYAAYIFRGGRGIDNVKELEAPESEQHYAFNCFLVT